MPKILLIMMAVPIIVGYTMFDLFMGNMTGTWAGARATTAVTNPPLRT